MRFDVFLNAAIQQLVTADVTTARLDCLILLEDITGMDRALILAHPEMQLQAQQQQILQKQIADRSRHIPLAYIRGKVAFYGHDFTVTPAVLVPRPESEAMIDLLRDIAPLPLKPRIIDIGTGSGCLGISAALALPDAEVWLSDIDRSALDIARSNADRHGVDAHIVQQDLLASQDNGIPYDVVLANLPYVPDAYPINSAASYEPSIALFAGSDGLDLYRTFWRQIAARPLKPAHIMTESLLDQHEALSRIAMDAGYTLRQTNGLIQHFTA